mgnify:CR=1 FL=1
MTVGERMKARRKSLGISADKVAEALGVSRSTIFRYEKGDIDKVPSEQLEPIARVLKTSVGYLMGWVEEPGISTSGRFAEPSSELSEDEIALVELYRRANEDDRQAVRLILRKYEDPAKTAPANAG